MEGLIFGDSGMRAGAEALGVRGWLLGIGVGVDVLTGGRLEGGGSDLGFWDQQLEASHAGVPLS